MKKTTETIKIGKDVLLSKLSETTGLTKKVCETVFDGLSEVILELLKGKYTVSLGSLGQFKYKCSAARECRSIQSGEKIQVPAKGVATFVLSKKAKDLLAKIV